MWHETIHIYKCNTLQHTATHCTTLHKNNQKVIRGTNQYIYISVTQFKTLQLTATHCSTLQHTVTHRNTLHTHK